MELFVMLGAVGIWQIAIVAVLVLLIFGGKKIPEMMKGLGSGIKEFKKGISEDEDDGSKAKKEKE